ncbi:MAG: mechanosensitive ion channel family protein [Actinobacteria bacterium]|nr:mechanosensitive ion channel family protein [Actinomycetota bacterium]
MLPLLAADDEAIVDTSRLDTIDWVWAGVILVLAIALSVVARRLAGRIVERAGGRPALGRVLGRVVAAIIVTIGLVSAVGELGLRVGPVLGALGIGGVALAFALQDILSNLVAGIILQLRNQFRIGDQVTTNDFDGTVRDITMRTVVLDTFAGERVVLPSSLVLQSPLVNHTAFDVRRSTVRVGVDYGTDPDVAAEVLRRAVTGVDGVVDAPPVAVWADTFGESSVELAVMFWHASREADEWEVRHRVVVAVHRGLAAADITIPFPQRTVHLPSRDPSTVPTDQGATDG